MVTVKFIPKEIKLEVQYNDVITIGDRRYMVIKDVFGDYPILLLALNDMKIVSCFESFEALVKENTITNVMREYDINIKNSEQ